MSSMRVWLQRILDFRVPDLLIKFSGFAVLCALVGFGGTAFAQSNPVEAFYKGRTMQAIVGYPPGSTYDLYLRTANRYLSQYLPGNPNIITQNMMGAGSLRATGYLANVAPKDGSVIGMPNSVNILEPLIDPKRTKFDSREFAWIGSFNSEITTCAFWAKDIKTLDDLKRRQVVVGSTGPSSGSTTDALLLNALLGTKFKLVTGYAGLAEAQMAAERKEVDGHCGYQVAHMKSTAWDEFKAGVFSVPVQIGITKHHDLPNVPNAYDLAKTDEDRQLLKLMFAPWAFGRPLMAPPGTPADRVAALRKAFDNTITDPKFLSEAKKLNLEIQPMDATAIAKLVDEIYRTPPATIERARVLLSVDKR